MMGPDSILEFHSQVLQAGLADEGTLLIQRSELHCIDSVSTARDFNSNSANIKICIA